MGLQLAKISGILTALHGAIYGGLVRVHASWIFLTVTLAVVLGFYCLVLLHRRGSSRVHTANCDWAEGFSIAKYRPMQRLLSREDLLFLRSQPGYDLSLEKSLCKDRRRVFRSYLKSLRRDFDR